MKKLNYLVDTTQVTDSQDFEHLSWPAFVLKRRGLDQSCFAQGAQNTVTLPMVHELGSPGKFGLGHASLARIAQNLHCALVVRLNLVLRYTSGSLSDGQLCAMAR